MEQTNSETNGLPSWASRGLASPLLAPTCTCHCTGQPKKTDASEELDRFPPDRNSSTTSSHYFTPSSSFHEDNGKDTDSLEYKPVVASSPTRKTSLDRILSSKSSKQMYTSSPNQLATGREKSLSPVSGPAMKLSTSMSNASIHSNYSEDSLMAGHNDNHSPVCCHCTYYTSRPYSGATHPKLCSAHYDTFSPSHTGQPLWNSGVGPCMGIENRPTNHTTPTAATVPHSDSPQHRSEDFSKDSLNSTNRETSPSPKDYSPVKAPIDHRQESEELQQITQEPSADDEISTCSSESKKLEPLAFTIDFGDTSKSKKKETPKRFTDRLNSSHRRNLSQSRVDEKKSECGAQSPGSSVSGEKMLKSLSRVSDSPLTKFNLTDDDSRRRNTPVTVKNDRSSSANSRLSSINRNEDQGKTNNSIRTKQSPSPPVSPTKTNTAGSNHVYNNGNSAKPHAMDMQKRNLIDNQRGSYEISRNDLQHKNNISEAHTRQRNSVDVQSRSFHEGHNHHTQNEKMHRSLNESQLNRALKENLNIESSSEDRQCSDSHTSAPNEERDDVSETGTYTIGKDSPSPDEEQSRRDIDRVFGVMSEQTTKPSSLDIENHATPNWIREWAAQVAQQQEPPHSPALAKPPSAPRSSDTPGQRPRRRLPSVPLTSSNPRSRSSPRPSDMSDPSDSSLETESFLRDTESVVCAMQARVDGRSSTESDVDTRSSSSFRHPFQQPELENSIGRKLSAQLRAKIRSLDESYPPSGSSSARGLLRETSYVVSSPTVIHNELHGDDSKSLHSDSSSDVTSGEATSRARSLHEEQKTAASAPTVRYNRALSLRRGRLGLDSESAPIPSVKDRRGGNISPSRGSSPQIAVRKQSSNTPPILTTTSGNKVTVSPTPLSSAFSRNDGGRFSLRVGSKSASANNTNLSSNNNTSVNAGRSKVAKNHSNIQSQNSNSETTSRKNRSSSTLSSKEAEFQNWKRRKNYDPMKAAAEGKKKEAARRAATITMSQSMIGPVTNQVVSSPSTQSPSPPPRTMVRSASFTCVNNVDAIAHCESPEPQPLYNNCRRVSQQKPIPMHQPTHDYSSEDDNEVVFTHKKPSPLTQRKYIGLNFNSPSSLPNEHNDFCSLTNNDLDITSSPGSPRRKLYLEEGSLLRNSTSNSSLRARSKLEALDNLVISTIHGLSGKIRTNAEGLFRKLRHQYGEDSERLSLIDDTMTRLSECLSESPIHSVATSRSTSRELAGTLKILKRVEQVFQALDQILFEEGLEGGGEESAILHDGTTTEGEEWNGYNSGEFY